jgi:D-glycero-alpha-D-manno-heptose-7-phosphate kinase
MLDEIIVRAPHRISLLGGGTDNYSFIQRMGHSLVFGAAISAYAYVHIRRTRGQFNSKFRLTYRIREEVNEVSQIKHPVVKAAFKMVFGNESSVPPLDITYSTDLPAGSGMATSSAFTAALLLGLFHIAERRDISEWEIAHASYKLERQILNEAGGIQDQYFCSLGGINAFNFSPTHIEARQNTNLIKCIEKIFEQGFIIFTQITRSSDIITASYQQNLDLKCKYEDSIYSLANEGLELAYQGNKDAVLELVQLSGDMKLELPGVDETGDLSALACELKALGFQGVKLLGAGGGGFFFAAAPKSIVNNAIANSNIRLAPVQVSHSGVHILFQRESN